MSLFDENRALFEDHALWGPAPSREWHQPFAAAPAVACGTPVTHGREILQPLEQQVHPCTEMQRIQKTAENTGHDATSAPRSVRHFLRDARSPTLPFTEVYYLDTKIPEPLRDERGRVIGNDTVRLHFMLRECETENEFDLYKRYNGDDPIWFMRGGRLRVAFDTVNSALIQPENDRRDHGRRGNRPRVNFYDEVARVYGVQFAPLYEYITLRLDTRFPHSRHAPAAMDVQCTSLLGTRRNARSAVQHADIVNVYSTMRQYASHQPAPSKETLAYFVRYYKHVYENGE